MDNPPKNSEGDVESKHLYMESILDQLFTVHSEGNNG